MREEHNILNSDRERKTLRDTSLACDTNKYKSQKKRLCFKCGEEFLSECYCNRLCEKCSPVIIDDDIALHTHSVNSEPPGEEDPVSLYSPEWQGGEVSR